jgi:hypothetical protein
MLSSIADGDGRVPLIISPNCGRKLGLVTDKLFGRRGPGATFRVLMVGFGGTEIA